MRADQLQRAARSILALLQASDVLSIIKQCRVARGEERQVAYARLEHAGAVLIESFESVDSTQQIILKSTHLESLGTPEYWRELLGSDADDAMRQSELVRLYSRVMFASSHLPSLLSVLEDSGTATNTTSGFPPPQVGEEAITIKLSDAGEKASDPDRVARAIDGLDMLYSACASLVKKPVMDLQLLGIRGTIDRDITLLGNNEAISAVKTVVGSIPDAVADIDPEDEIDIQELVHSLPVFGDLKTLKKLGTFLPSDLQDIHDTMYQGVLLSLESGVVLVADDVLGSEEDELAARRATATNTISETGESSGSNPVSADESKDDADEDEYYNQYLREKDRLLQDEPAGAASGKTSAPTASPIEERDNAIENLIKGLKG